jgi:hypothetical protein
MKACPASWPSPPIAAPSPSCSSSRGRTRHERNRAPQDRPGSFGRRLPRDRVSSWVSSRPPADLMRREEAHAYPTNFNAMSDEWIERLSLRGEQLTLCLACAYLPHLINEPSCAEGMRHAH